RSLPVGGPVSRAVFSPDGRRLALVDDQGVKLWDTATWEEVTRLLYPPLPNPEPDFRHPPADVVFSPDGRHLISTSTALGPLVRIWDVATGKEATHQLLYLRTATGRLTKLAFSPDGTTLATGGTRGDLTLWNVGTWGQRAQLVGHRTDV